MIKGPRATTQDVMAFRKPPPKSKGKKGKAPPFKRAPGRAMPMDMGETDTDMANMPERDMDTMPTKSRGRTPY